MMIAYRPIVTIFLTSVFLLASAIIPVYTEADTANPERMCPSGYSAANLTGWILNDKTPVGKATYNETTRTLDVEVSSVGLADGTKLLVLVGDQRIGQMEPLKSGAARATLTRPLEDGARVRVFDGDRPIVSANLACVSAPVPAIQPISNPTVSPTVSPSPSATASPGSSPTPSPTPSPALSPSPSPTLAPAPDPMPKRSPDATPTP